MKKIIKRPELEATMQLQVKAFLEGRKPAVLFLNRDPWKYLNGETYDAMELDQGIIVFRDEETRKLIEDGHIGYALGYGIDDKPKKNAVNLTAYVNGIPFVDVQVDSMNFLQIMEVSNKLKDMAGENAKIELRSLGDVIKERGCQ